MKPTLSTVNKSIKPVISLLSLLLIVIPVFVFLHGSADEEEPLKMKYNKLTEQEEYVIIKKGTERPFVNEYYKNKTGGFYICKRCDAPLYHSRHKFDSNCGWPSFDDQLFEAVKRVPDADGSRTEILCARCDGHLGHVFKNEGYTPKNTRHCVNSISLRFVPEEKTSRAIFASGCFWGTEYHFKRTRGVLDTSVGYIGGRTENPSYKDVCSGSTGHAEAVEVLYEPSITSYTELVKVFFETHDPSQVNRQGPDVGEQYRSEIFFINDEQKKEAQKVIAILEGKGYRVATRLTEATPFWKGEDYHQDYYQKKKGTPYCHIYTKRF